MSCCVLSTNASSASRSGVNHRPKYTSSAYFSPMCCLKCDEVALQAQSFEFAVRGNQQRSARRFVTAARLDADETVLHQVDAADGIASADLVQQLDQRNRIELHPVHGNRSALFEADFDLLLAVGSFLRRTGQLPGAGERRVARIFQFPALVADVPQVAIAAVDLLAAGGHGNAALLGIVEAVFARLQIPLAPRRDHLQLRSQRLVGQFEAHLIVALAGAAVRHRSRALAQRHFHLCLAITGRASEVPSRYLCSYTAPAFSAGNTYPVRNSSRMSSTITLLAPVLYAFSTTASMSSPWPTSPTMAITS